jgi:hypothetical protein
MQKFVTPHPGRTPAQKGNIVNREDYKLDVQVKEFRQNQYVLTIDSFIPEHGWISKQYFLTPEELVRVQHALDASK